MGVKVTKDAIDLGAGTSGSNWKIVRSWRRDDKNAGHPGQGGIYDYPHLFAVSKNQGRTGITSLVIPPASSVQLREVCRVKTAMALKHREHVKSLLSHTVDNTVGAQKHFPDILSL